MEIICNQSRDEEFSQEHDLAAYGTPTNHFKDSPTNSPTSSSITHLSRSSTPLQSPDQHEPSCECHGQQKLSNPIAQAFRDVELGKVFLTMVMPISTILLAVPNRESFPQLLPWTLTLCLISAAMVFLFYGNSLRIIYPQIANAFEQLGTACMYASFFMAICSHLPPTLAWFPLVCFIACIILSAVSCLPFEKKKCWYCSKVLKPS
ncbi:hypothetical protein Acr_12g0002750 [Actinidia rufa]|uniref:Uncharacterized protein n=1 Tax=Actinidia rufa TaxID=165716 RepID=A0A7J0FGA2_9ERIC|nr:hypothetical protein Acr_12g0002750 [Actinidia rufa]